MTVWIITAAFIIGANVGFAVGWAMHCQALQNAGAADLRNHEL